MKSIIIGAALVLATSASFAQTTVGPVHLQQVVTGWNSEAFSVNAGTAMPNPAGCGATDLAGTSINNPGYKTFYAAALTAMANDTPVLIVVSNSACEGARPRLIGITLNRS